MQEDVVAAPVFAGPLNIPFAELRAFSNQSANQCRYIADEPPDPEYRACGNETLPGQSYCSHCYAITRNQSTLTQAERANHIRIGRQNHFRAQRKAVA